MGSSFFFTSWVRHCSCLPWVSSTPLLITAWMRRAAQRLKRSVSEASRIDAILLSGWESRLSPTSDEGWWSGLVRPGRSDPSIRVPTTTGLDQSLPHHAWAPTACLIWGDTSGCSQRARLLWGAISCDGADTLNQQAGSALTSGLAKPTGQQALHRLSADPGDEWDNPCMALFPISGGFSWCENNHLPPYEDPLLLCDHWISIPMSKKAKCLFADEEMIDLMEQQLPMLFFLSFHKCWAGLPLIHAVLTDREKKIFHFTK